MEKQQRICDWHEASSRCFSGYSAIQGEPALDGTFGLDALSSRPRRLQPAPHTPLALGAIVEDDEEEESDEELLDEDTVDLTHATSNDHRVGFKFTTVDIPQAFSCFSHKYSNRRYLVCDLQVFLDETSDSPCFELTDPVIHYSSNSERKNVFGRTDRGEKGINAFYKTHNCSALCGALEKTWIETKTEQNASPARYVSAREGLSLNLITQQVEYVQGDDVYKEDRNRKPLLLDLVSAVKGLILVFTATKERTDWLEDWLVRQGFPSTSIHGDRTQREQEWALKSFRSGQTPILFTTDVKILRKLETPYLTHVINFDMPYNIDEYVERNGLSLPADKNRLATSFFRKADDAMAPPLVKLLQETGQKVPSFLPELAAQRVSSGTKLPPSVPYEDYHYDDYYSDSDDDGW